MSTIRLFQALTGVIFSTFLCLHVATHISAIWGPDSFNNSLKLYRPFYQNPIFEFYVLPASVIIHVICGFITSRQRVAFQSLVDRLFAYSGWFMMIMVGMHAYMERWNAIAFGSKFDADFSIFGSSMVANGTVPMVAYGIIWGAAGVLHMTLGLVRALATLKVISAQTSVQLRRSPLVLLLVLAIAGLVTTGVVAMIPGYWYEPDPKRLNLFVTVYKEGVEAAQKL